MTTRDSFATPFGIVPTDRPIIADLIDRHEVTDNSAAFLSEHGIYNILPFIRTLWPEVPIIPIITRDSVPTAAVDRLKSALETDMTYRTLIVASLDFAHNQTNDGAARLDATSLIWLQSVAPDQVPSNVPGTIAVDSPLTLRLFLGLMRDRGATNFTLMHHSNSALETGHLEATDVTSYITGTYRVSPVKK